MSEHCGTCKHSALCLPQGVHRFFESRFQKLARKVGLKYLFSKFELMTYQGNPDTIVKDIEEVYRRTAAELPCDAAPGMSIVPRQNADLVELSIRFSDRRRVGYYRLNEMYELRRDLQRSIRKV